jgi:hypothetical protein
MVLSLSGLPFTPTTAGISGLIVLPFNALDILYILVYAFLLLGFLWQQIKQDEAFDETTGWMRAIYWVGLTVILLGFWFLSIPSIQNNFSSPVWWGGIPSFVIALGGVYGLYRFIGAENISLPEDSPIIGQLQGESVVYKVSARLYFGLRSAIQFITDLLEGDSAILWILLVFLMVMTMILQGGNAG